MSDPGDRAARDAQFVEAVELHSLEQLAALLAAGLDVRAPVAGKPATTWLTEMYTRSDRFALFLRVLLEHGAVLDDPLLAPVLLDDVAGLQQALAANRKLLRHRTTMRCAFTPLIDCTLLHVACEFGHVAAVRALLDAGAAVDARAGFDDEMLGAQSPLFHTVNSNGNRSEPVMRMLLDAGARADLPVLGFTWGAGFDWETTFFDLTPISYAQLGTLPQMHRDARDIDANVRALLTAAGRRVPRMPNVPNRYLQPRR